MLATSGPFQAMVEGQEQTLAWSLSMTLPAAASAYDDVTLAVQALEIDESTATDAPDGTRLEEGYSSVQATFTLSGLVDQSDESKSAGWLFGPYSLTSPLYHSDAFRAPVVIKLGLHPDGAGGVPELLTKFTGYVEDYTVDEDGNVAFTCLDLRSDFRGSVTLPAVVTAAPFNAGVTSEFAVDAVLRAASGGAVSSWPAQRANCVLAAGLRSSIWPEVGAIDVTDAPFAAVAFGQCLYGSGLVPQPSGTYILAAPVTTVAFIEYLVTVGDGLPVGVVLGMYGVDENFKLNVSSGGVSVALRLNSVTTAQTVGSALTVGTSHYLAVSVTLPAAGGHVASGTVYVDNNSYAFSVDTGAGNTRLNASWPHGWPAPVGGVSVSTIAGLQVTTETSPAPNNTFTPQAVLDRSLNPLQLVPAIDGDPWQTIQTIAAAELAVAGFDEAGIFRYTNRQTIRGKTSSRSITSTTSLKSLGIAQSAAAVVNRAQIGWTGWTYATAASTVYSATAPIKVARNSTKVVNATLDSFAVQLDSSLSKLPNSSSDTTHSFYRASTSKAGVTEHPGGLSFTVTQASADKLTITVVNSSSIDAWLVSPANYTDIAVGTPVLRVAGTLVTVNDEITADWQWPPVSAGGAASSRFGEVAWQLTGNTWIQDEDTATQLATDIVIDSYIPRPDLTGVSIVPDPRLQLTDVALIQDLDRTGVNEYGRIFASTVTFDAGGGNPSYEQSIDARTLAPPGGWIMGFAGRSETGTTTYVNS